MGMLRTGQLLQIIEAMQIRKRAKTEGKVAEKGASVWGKHIMERFEEVE